MAHCSFDPRHTANGEASPDLLVLEVRQRENPHGPLVGVFLVERRESVRAQDRYATADASIQISYRQIMGERFSHVVTRGGFVGSYHEYNKTVTLTSGSLTGGGVFLDPPSLQGNSLRTYLMNEVVLWAKRWPNASINTISLVAHQGHDANKARRNQFYEQFGLAFAYADADRKAGQSQPMMAKELIPSDAWKKNIVRHNLVDFLNASIERAEHAELDLQIRTRTLKEAIAELRRIEGRPIRWALMQHARVLFWLFAMGFAACAIWIRAHGL